MEKYKLVNIDKGQKFLVSTKVPGGKVRIDAITDEIAEKLYPQSRYIAKVKSKSKQENNE